MTGLNAGSLEINGRLTMDTVPALYESGLRQLMVDDLRVDFSQVEAVDSAALGMLLGWERAAQHNQRKLIVASLPDDLLSLARLYGVEDMLPLHAD